SRPDEMPDELRYDEGKRRLLIGNGYVENVTHQMWEYEVSGKNVLRQWFSYRKATRERPIIGERRQPSKRGDIQSEGWVAEFTTELSNLLNVLGLLVGLEPRQADLLHRICEGETICEKELQQGGALAISSPSMRKPKATRHSHPTFFAD